MLYGAEWKTTWIKKMRFSNLSFTLGQILSIIYQWMLELKLLGKTFSAKTYLFDLILLTQKGKNSGKFLMPPILLATQSATVSIVMEPLLSILDSEKF